MSRFTFDVEANNLLNDETIDYNASPYKLKDTFSMHCVVLENQETNELIAFYNGETYEFDGRFYAEEIEGETYKLEAYEPIKYTHYQLDDFNSFVKDNVTSVVGHNIINYDLLACKLYFKMPYSVKYSTWNNTKVEILDTMIISKVLNPDRFGGHSLDELSSKTDTRKVAFRKSVPIDIRFKHFAADMLYYCMYDVISNTKVYNMLMEEWGEWDWQEAFILEQRIADIITRQEHRGFAFDKKKAQQNLEELDVFMEERRARAEPILPPKPATKGYLKDFIPPKLQFKKSDGEPTANLIKFAAKHNGEILKDDYGKYSLKLDDKIMSLPLSSEEPICEPLVPATLNDTTHIKDWLVGMGWSPSEYKDKDLMKKSGPKKEVRTPVELEKAIDSYVAQTLASSFCQDRCDHLETTPDALAYTLKARAQRSKSLKVLTNPSFTKGQDKDICPNLALLGKRFPYATDIVEYLTYRHRRNSILGGGADYDEDEEDYDKGYLAAVRSDGRIPTPAATCDAATSRMKHRSVANIPRVTSLYGYEMRSLFGVTSNYFQIGYDFDSLEARIEAHYCWRYEEGRREYCNSLLLDKPLDVHSMMAKRITDMIGKKFERGPAKSVKYGCTYGAQAAKTAKTIGSDLHTGELVFTAFWEAAKPLALLKEKLNDYWVKTGKRYILGIDGRRVPTRSAHAILNSLFQSGGVICAKRAMLIHEDLLEEKGLLVDFFEDDWRNKSFCQQMIAYHDEAQVEVTKDLVEFKWFSKADLEWVKFEDAKLQKAEDDRCEALVKKWKADIEAKTGKLWSNVHESPKGGWFLGYSLPGELAARAVAGAGEYYKLNIGLTAGYDIGRNWAQCH